MYNKKVLEIFKNPKHVGKMSKPDGIGEIGNAKCGDIMRMYLKIDENEIITDATFQTFGCAAAIASTSTACDMIIGKSITDALKLTNKDVLDYLGGLPDFKVHCSLLAEEVIKLAVENYYKKQKKITAKK